MMTLMVAKSNASEAASLVKNSEKIIKHFGEWPSFHDAEIMKIELDRDSISCQFEVYYFKTLDEVDSRGFYKQTANCRLIFQLQEIETLELAGFNCQNVISNLSIERSGDLLKVTFHPSYGLSGTIHCHNVVLKSLKPTSSNRVPRIRKNGNSLS